MTQEEKDILIKDLCARLPYRVKCCIYNFGENTIRIKEDILWSVQGDNILTLKSCVEKGEAYMYHQIKPYLLPLSSMTEEQRKEMHNYSTVIWDNSIDSTSHEDRKIYCAALEIEWLDKNHFDYRGLIPMGLAKDATGLNIYS